MIGQTSPIDPTTKFTDTIKALTARVAELERAQSRHPAFEIVYASLTPSSNEDATTSGTFTQWLNLGAVFVPSWATTAIVQMNLTAIFDITAAGNIYELRTTLGPAASSTTARAEGFGIEQRFAVSWSSAVTLAVTGGNSTLAVQAARQSGTGRLRASTVSSEATAIVTFV